MHLFYTGSRPGCGPAGGPSWAGGMTEQGRTVGSWSPALMWLGLDRGWCDGAQRDVGTWGWSRWGSPGDLAKVGMAMGALGALREVGKGFHGFFLVIILRSWMPYGKVVNSSGFFFKKKKVLISKLFFMNSYYLLLSTAIAVKSKLKHLWLSSLHWLLPGLIKNK